jgi:peptide/histidine transporter 3/4
MVGIQEFFYDQMPSEMRSLGLALYYSVSGMGGFISGALVALIDRITTSSGGDSWFADNLNHAHLDYFYWLLAAISAAELALFIRLASSYIYRPKMLT